MKRHTYIDFIESIAIFMVIFCHGVVAGESVAANIALQLTTTIAVPLFFLANGALLFNSPTYSLEKHLKKTGVIALTIVTWRLLYLILGLIFHRLGFSVFSFTQIAQYLLGKNIDSPFHVYSEHLWFLYELLAIYIMFPLLKCAWDKDQRVIKLLSVWCFVFVYLYSDTVWFLEKYSYKDIVSVLQLVKGILFPFGRGASYLLFFLLGGLIHNRYLNGKTTYSRRWYYFAASVLSFLGLLILKYIQEGSLYGKWVRLDNDYTRVFTLIMAVSFYIFSTSIHIDSEKVQNAIAFISSRTMNIYLIHFLFTSLFSKIVTALSIKENLAMHFIRTLAILILSIIVTEPLT